MDYKRKLKTNKKAPLQGLKSNVENIGVDISSIANSKRCF